MKARRQNYNDGNNGNNGALDYPSFLLALREKLLESEDLKLEPRFLRFLVKGERGQTEEDRFLIQDINETYFQKKAPALLDDFLAIKVPNEKGSGTMRFMLRGLYQEYQREGFDRIMETIRRNLRLNTQSSVVSRLSALHDYGVSAPHLIIRPLNYERNRASLKKAVYRLVGDIALVLYVELSYDGTNTVSTKIERPFLKEWGKSKEEVLEDALVNTSILAPPRMYRDLKDKVNPSYEHGAFMDLNRITAPLSEHDVPTITTTRQMSGAVAMFYPGVKERLGELFGGSYYAAFTSTRDLKLLKQTSTTPETVLLRLRCVNLLFPDGMLSSQVFLYDQGQKTLRPVSPGRGAKIA